MKALSLALVVLAPISGAPAVPPYPDNPFVIELDIPAPTDSAGGLICADLDDDGALDYLVTVPGHVAAYGHNGKPLWIHKTNVRVGGSSEREGLPGHHGPGVQAADIDGDGATEVLYLTRDSVLHVVQGKSGEEKWSATPPVPDDAAAWEHAVVVNLRGAGDRDILLQATNSKGYRTGRHLAAYDLARLQSGETEPLWRTDDFVSCAHNGARAADLDGDGRDEIIGGTLLGPDGRVLCELPVHGHIDSVFVADVRPDLPGLEVVALEEQGNRVFLCNTSGLIWKTDYRRWEPQNAAVGEFDPTRPGLEIWCRSRFNTHQKPFVFDAQGNLIVQYELDAVAPDDWTDEGVEVIWTIDWTGEPKRLAAAKERHTAGDVAVFDPMDGRFVHRIDEKADRLYVADVAGDAREEIVVLSGSSLRVYAAEGDGANPDAPSPWTQPAYRRSKTTWNYYSP